MRYNYKRLPRNHQRVADAAWGNKTYFALLMEQGTGKTKVIVDRACYYYAEGLIDVLIVMAPPDVRIGWVIDALPKDMWASVPYRAAWYESNPRKQQRLDMEAVLEQGFVGLRVITMHYEAVSMKKGKGQKYLEALLRNYRCMLVCDESSAIKNIKANRAEFLVDHSTRAPIRAIMNGTPITRGPFDAFAQFLFLDEHILGFSSYPAFKAHYCEMEAPDSGLLQHIARRANAARVAAGKKPMHAHLVENIQVPKRDANGRTKYQHLDELNKAIAPWSFRVLKSECLDLPPKVYSKRYIELPDVQRKLYDSVRDNLITELVAGSISPAMKMTRMLRLQQILGGYYVLDDDRTVHSIFNRLDSNPRLESVGNVFEQCSGKLIVWARFTHEVDAVDTYLRERFADEGFTGVKHYGLEKSSAVREVNKKRYMEDDNVRWFVGTQAAGARGLDGLQNVTSAVYYYSNTFVLDDRLQSEDRAHRDGTTGTVSIYDAVALGTLDERLVQDLRDKKDVADIITGDPKLEWI